MTDTPRPAAPRRCQCALAPHLALLAVAFIAGCFQELPPASSFADIGVGGLEVASDGAVGGLDGTAGDGGDAGGGDAIVTDDSAADAADSADVTDSADAAPKDAADAAPTDATDAADAAPKDAADVTGQPCKTAADCGPAPSQCTAWQCTGLCYPLPANTGACDDGDACTVGDVCFAGTCQQGTPKGCDDSNPCTADACGPGGACAHDAKANGVDCGGGKLCMAGVCSGGVGDGVSAVTAAAESTCAIAAGGKVFCWGDDAAFQVGAAKPSGKWFTKPEPVAGLAAASAVQCGGNHCCAVTGGGLFCWGDDQFGQSSGKGDGQKPSAYVKTPTLVAVPAVQVAVGEYHTCALDTGGVIRCWGLGSNGQLGDGKGGVGVKPVLVALPHFAMAVACGRTHCCALAGGVPYCWGYNGSGQIGIGTTAEAPTPLAAKGVTDAVQLGLGASHSCVRAGTGAVWCWGANGSGQTGLKGASYDLTPGKVPGIATASDIAAGGAHTCAVQSGALWCWGNNGAKQVAPGNSAIYLTAPAAVQELPTGVVVAAMALGGSHTCVRGSDATLWCWGANNLGQIGLGTTKDVGKPTAVP